MRAIARDAAHWRAPSWVVNALAGVGVIGLSAGALGMADGWWALSWVGYLVIGALILRRRPENSIGWLLLVIGLAWSLAMVSYLLLDRFPGAPGLVWLEMFSSMAGYTAWILLILIPVLFPSGRPADRFTRALSITLILVLMGVIVAELVSSTPKELTGVTSPLAFTPLAGLAGFMLNDGFLIVPVLLVASLGSLVPRWRRAGGVERAQYAWFLAGLAVAIVGLIASQLIPDDAFLAFSIAFTSCLLLIPTSIAIAVLRYRLYEIDRLLSRTVTYGLVIAALGSVYALGAVWLPTQLLGEQPEVFVAGSTLLSAALFNPLRRRIRRVVDRRFNRSHYRAEMVVEEFVRDLRYRLESGDVTTLMTTVVADTLQPSFVRMWVRDAHHQMGGDA